MARANRDNVTGAEPVEVDTRGTAEGQPLPADVAPDSIPLEAEEEEFVPPFETVVPETTDEEEEFVPPFETVVPEGYEEANEPAEVEGPAVVLISSYGEYETEYGVFTLGEPASVESDEVRDALVALRGPHGEQLFRAV